MYFGINRRRNLGGSKAKRARSWLNQWSLAVLFMPGAFFLAMGACAVLAPQLLILAIAGFFVFLGLSFFFLAWKFIQLKKRFEHVARNLEARVVLQGVNLGRPDEDDPGDEKKVVYH